MKKHRVVWVLILLVLVAGLAILIPGTPLYLPNLLNSKAQFEGHGTGYWAKALDDPEPDNRSHAAKALGAIGPDAADAVPALAAHMLKDTDRPTTINASLALTKIGPAVKIAVPQLAEALESDEPVVRLNAAQALLLLGKEARPAAPALLKAIKEERNRTNCGIHLYTIQQMAARALGQATADTDEAVPALMALLEEAEKPGGAFEMRMAVARALGEIGPPARPALPLLRPLLKEKTVEVHESAAFAIERIEGKPVEKPTAGETGGT